VSPMGIARNHDVHYRAKREPVVTVENTMTFGNILDLGCGVGLVSQKLTKRAEHVLGIDIAAAAIGHARRRGAAFTNLEFEPGDILNLSRSLDGRFDLVVIADVLYYLSPLDTTVLKSAALRIAARSSWQPCFPNSQSIAG